MKLKNYMQKVYDSTSIAEQFIVLCQKLISYYHNSENLKHVKLHNFLNFKDLHIVDFSDTKVLISSTILNVVYF